MLPNQHFDRLFSRNPDAFIRALQLQSHSLEHFEYVTPGDGPGASVPTETFESFTRLQEVRLTQQLRDDLRDHLITTTPNLRVLTIGAYIVKLADALRDADPSYTSSTELPREEEESKRKRLLNNVPNAFLPDIPKTAISSLKELRVVLHPPGSHCICGKMCIELLGTYWKSYGVELYISHRPWATVIPPILYDERNRAPVNVLLYSTKGGVTEAAEDKFRPGGPGFFVNNGMPDFMTPFDFLPGDPGDVLDNFEFDTFHPPDAFGFDTFDFDSFNVDALVP